MGLGSTATTGGGGNGSSLILDPLTEYGNGAARLEAQGRATDMSIDFAMAMQDQGPMYFVLSRFPPPSVTHTTAVPLPPMQPPQPTEEHLQVLMVPDMFNIELPRDDSISMGEYHYSPGMTTISPADTMNSPLHSALTPAMAAMSATPNMVGSPYLSAKDEPVEDDDYHYDDNEYDNDHDNDIENDRNIDNDMEDEDCKDERGSSVDNTMKTESDINDAKLKPKRNERDTPDSWRVA
ncbi:hypothetical protein BGW39_008593 [Mortierella sp. 14UC]|nr:hypothetical protein BGW39_008593 [Mortierella sp. 14UC]